jgi:hypothetical protein
VNIAEKLCAAILLVFKMLNKDEHIPVGDN